MVSLILYDAFHIGTGYHFNIAEFESGNYGHGVHMTLSNSNYSTNYTIAFYTNNPVDKKLSIMFYSYDSSGATTDYWRLYRS